MPPTPFLDHDRPGEHFPAVRPRRHFSFPCKSQIVYIYVQCKHSTTQKMITNHEVPRRFRGTFRGYPGPESARKPSLREFISSFLQHHKSVSPRQSIILGNEKVFKSQTVQYRGVNRTAKRRRSSHLARQCLPAFTCAPINPKNNTK
jgi:hypothetical protein